MDLSELTKATIAPPRRPPQLLDSRALVAQLGGEVAANLSAALERVTALTATGRIDKSGLRALREEIDLARRAGIMGQQVVRLANGHVPVAHEPLDLSAMVREALRQRNREIDGRGIEVRQVLAAAEVLCDSTLLYSLLQTTLDWSFEHTRGRIDVDLDCTPWPTQARLVVGFPQKPADEVDHTASPLESVEQTGLNTMSWRLLQQTASVLGLIISRKDSAGRTELALQFPDTLTPRLPGLSVVESDEAHGSAQNSQPLAGRHVVVVAARRELRNTIRESLRPMGLMLDFVFSVDEARHLCSDSIPHALVYDGSLGGDRFEALREQILAEIPGVAFICITEHGRGFEVLNVGGRQFASVARNAILEALPAALLFELTRNES